MFDNFSHYHPVALGEGGFLFTGQVHYEFKETKKGRDKKLGRKGLIFMVASPHSKPRLSVRAAAPFPGCEALLLHPYTQAEQVSLSFHFWQKPSAHMAFVFWGFSNKWNCFVWVRSGETGFPNDKPLPLRQRLQDVHQTPGNHTLMAWVTAALLAHVAQTG